MNVLKINIDSYLDNACNDAKLREKVSERIEDSINFVSMEYQDIKDFIKRNNKSRGYFSSKITDKQQIEWSKIEPKIELFTLIIEGKPLEDNMIEVIASICKIQFYERKKQELYEDIKDVPSVSGRSQTDQQDKFKPLEWSQPNQSLYYLFRELYRTGAIKSSYNDIAKVLKEVFNLNMKVNDIATALKRDTPPKNAIEIDKLIKDLKSNS